MYSKLRRGYWDPGGIRTPLSLLVLVLVLALAGCAEGSASSSSEQDSDDSENPGSEVSEYPDSKLETDLRRAPVGTEIRLTGAGFPADTDVDLSWSSFDGRYELEQEEVVFVGSRYDERTIDLTAVTTDESGGFDTEFTVPEDFGGTHDIVAKIDDQFATKAGFLVETSFSISATSGPVGTPLEVHATGIGYRAQESLWHVSWDNAFTGYMAAVNTRGSATAKIRMAGPPGQHVLKIWRNYRGIPYLNPHQGPFGDLPDPTTFVIDVQEGVHEGPNIWAHPEPQNTVQSTPKPNNHGGASLVVTPDQGTVGSSITIEGSGFPANETVELTWATRAGQELTNTGLLEGFEEELFELPYPTTASDGGFQLEISVPTDYAGPHRITATSGDHQAEAYYSIYASITELQEQAKVGEEITINMEGVGWTIQGKTYAVAYNNRYLGYGCSFSTDGDIELRLPAAGSPGYHIIDLYPAVYEGKDPTPDIYSIPNLTYQDNHPGGALPAFRLMIEVTE